jgi:RING-like zinc finger
MTLVIHRVRASRAAQRDRAPENIVKKLPWRVWNGTRLEKGADLGNAPGNDGEEDLEQGPSRAHLPWFQTQLECAICLEEFAKGDKVRVLPCEHIFHVDEIDDWLINRKKLVCLLICCLRLCQINLGLQCPVCKADVTQEHSKQCSDEVASPTPSSSPWLLGADAERSNTPTERTPLLGSDYHSSS